MPETRKRRPGSGSNGGGIEVDWWVMLILVGVFILAVGIAFYCWRRRQQRMREARMQAATTTNQDAPGTNPQLAGYGYSTSNNDQVPPVDPHAGHEGQAFPQHGAAYPPMGAAYPPSGSAYPPPGAAYPQQAAQHAYQPQQADYPQEGETKPGAAYPNQGFVYPPAAVER